jgi:hypothetical protein
VEQLRSPGLQLVGIGVVHNAIGLLLGREPIAAILAGGYTGAVDVAFDRMAIFWFLWFGWVLMLLGGAVRAIEPQTVPRWLVAGIAAMALGGAAAMPLSGFWLALIPVVGMLLPQPVRSSSTAA